MEEGQTTSVSGTDKSLVHHQNGSTKVHDSNRKHRNRTCLPSVAHSLTNFSVWSILKQCIGKDLSKITMPVVFNEPLSFLQRIVEYLEYCDLLRKASESQDPIERLEYVTAFAASGSPANHERLGKPFNPLLGETYEWDREDLGFKVVCEQVSHHPPVSAFHAESPIFTLHGSVSPKIRFWGKSIEITPKGTLTLTLLKHNEVYTWQNVNCCVHNIIVGKLWLEMYGALEITNHKTRHKAVLNFKPCGWFGKDLNKTVGYVYDDKKNKVRALYGKWTEGLYSCSASTWDDYQAGNLPPSALEPHTDATNGSVSQQLSYESSAPGADSGARPAAGGSKHSMKPSASVPVGVGSVGSKMDDKLSSHVAKLDVGDTATEDGDDDEEDFEDAESAPQESKEAILSTDFTPGSERASDDLRLPGQKTLWRARVKGPDAKKYYNFTTFAMGLNEMEPSLREKIAPTDSRLRQDMRYMEEGNLDASATEKQRLEEKQRSARKSQRSYSDESKPRWFKQQYNEQAQIDDWQFTSEYWQRDWRRCPRIF